MTISHQKGSAHGNADALSHLPPCATEHCDISAKQAQDFHLAITAATDATVNYTNQQQAQSFSINDEFLNRVHSELPTDKTFRK